MRRKPAHRGEIDNPPAFARKFVLGRLGGFEKDFQICLTPTHLNGKSKVTHAYFPALGACCGIMEYLTALYHGRIRNLGWQQIATWTNTYLPKEYDQDTIRILIEAFRHPIAHRGIASGIWTDRNTGPGNGRRLTWKVLANGGRPAIRVLRE